MQMGRRRDRRVCPVESSEDDGALALDARAHGGAQLKAEREPAAAAGAWGTTFLLLNRGRSRAAVYSPMAADAEGADFAAYTAITTRRVKLQLRDASGAALGQWAGCPITVSLRYEGDGAPVLYGSSMVGTGDPADLPLLFFEGAGEGRRCRACRLTLDRAGLSHEAFAILAPSHRHEGRRFELRVEAPGAPPVHGRVLVHTRTHAPKSARKGRPGAGQAAAAAAKRARRSAGRQSASSPSSAEAPGATPGSRGARLGGTETSSGSDVSLDSGEEESAGPQSAYAAAAFGDAATAPTAFGDWFAIPIPEAHPGAAGWGEAAPLDGVVDLLTATFSRATSLGHEDGPGDGPARPDHSHWLAPEEAVRVVPWGVPGSGPARPPPGRLAPDESAMLLADFDAARAPGALSGRPAVLRLLSILKDPRLLCTAAVVTPEAATHCPPRPAQPRPRRAFHDLRGAGAYAAVGVAVDAMASAALAIPEEYERQADAEAALDRVYGVLAASSMEVSVTFPDLLYLPWTPCSLLLRKAAAIVEPWSAQEPMLRCRLLYQRSLALFHHGFWESALEEAFAAWSELIRAQLTPSRLEATLLRHILELLMYLGKVEQARSLSARLYYFDASSDPADRFHKGNALHLLATVEYAINKRVEEAIGLYTRAVEAFEGLHPAYLEIGARSFGNRGIMLSHTGRTGGVRVLQARRDIKRWFSLLEGSAEAWSVHWSGWTLLRWFWCHPQDPSSEVARTLLPLKRLLKTMELMLALPIVDTKGRTPTRAGSLYELGCAYLLAGNNARAKKALEEARAWYTRCVPLHFPPESPRMQSIARAIEEAEARAAGRPPRDLFGFESRRVPGPGAGAGPQLQAAGAGASASPAARDRDRGPRDREAPGPAASASAPAAGSPFSPSTNPSTPSRTPPFPSGPGTDA
eukprot:tig00020553_g10698.t1